MQRKCIFLVIFINKRRLLLMMIDRLALNKAQWFSDIHDMSKNKQGSIKNMEGRLFWNISLSVRIENALIDRESTELVCPTHMFWKRLLCIMKSKAIFRRSSSKQCYVDI